MNPRPRKEPDKGTYSGRFAQRLKTLREKAGLTPQELADCLGVSDQAVYYWETGRNQPKISDLPKIAETLGITKARLILPNE